MGRKIALVSRRKTVIEFVTLEAKLWGYHVYATPVIPENMENVDILICDGVAPPSCLDGIAVYSLCCSDACSVSELSFPISLDELKGIFGEGGNAEPKEIEENIIYICDSHREVNYKNQFYILTEYEYKLLKKLGDQPLDSPVRRDELMRLFGAEKGNIADVYISRLRKKLEDPHGPRIIETVRGEGYSLKVKIKKYT